MGLFEKYVAAGRNKDLKALADVFHADYMYFVPTYLGTKESISEEFEKVGSKRYLSIQSHRLFTKTGTQ